MKSLVEEASTITKAVEKAWIRAGKPAEFTVKVFEEPKHNFFGMTTKSAKIAIFFKSTTPASHSQESKDAKPVQKDAVRKPQQPTRPHYDAAPTRPAQPKNYGSDTRNERDQRPTAAQQQRPVKNDRRDSRDYSRPSEAPRDTREWQEPRGSRQEHRSERNGHSEQPERTHNERSSYNDRNDRPSSRRDSRGRERPEAVWSNEMADIAQDWLENMLIVLDKRELLAQAKVVGPNLKFEFRSPILDDKEKEKLLFASWAHLMLASVGNKYKKDLHGLKIVLLGVE